MSRKSLMPANKISVDKSMGSNFETDPIKVDTADNIAFWINTSGVTDNTGDFVVQVRPYRNSVSFGEWTDLTLSSAIQLANADINHHVNLNQLPNCQIRLKFTAAGGTPNGTCNIWISGTGA